MVANQTDQKESGQSVMEFLLMLPFLLGITIILIRINTAIQIGIVNQQYARAHALFMAFNSPYYPELKFQLRELIGKQTSQVIIGVSDNPATGTDYVPEASVQLISRTKKVKAPDTPQEEPATRARVRIRNTVTLCAPSYFLASGQPVLPLDEKSFTATNRVNLNEGNAIQLFSNPCRSQMKYE